jgi:alginate O-acetyltransferase complex protein AlgI
MYEGGARTMTNSLIERFFNVDLWLVGIGHFIALCASFQVPFRLGWKEDLVKLRPFNRKLLWVQSTFTVLTIIAFGTFTLALHNEFLLGDHAAIGLSLFIGIFWAFRVGVDAFYFSHEDWPQGKQFVVGHILLTSLFVSFAISYLGLFCWHVWLKG